MIRLVRGEKRAWAGVSRFRKECLRAARAVKDAVVDILRQTTPSELAAYLGVLHANAMAILILAPPLLPEPGTVDRDVEATARVWDLSLLQLTNECGLELGELM